MSAVASALSSSKVNNTRAAVDWKKPTAIVPRSSTHNPEFIYELKDSRKKLILARKKYEKLLTNEFEEMG
jgi:hypothetical protein